MTISTGDRLPEAVFLEIGADGGPAEVTSASIFAGRRVVLFALPGAFTRTCSAAHLPSFLRTAPAFRAKGVDEIVCLAVNDPFVMNAWGAANDVAAAGIRMLADPSGAFTDALGMLHDIPASGLYGRSRRYAMLVEDGIVARLNPETGRGCDISAGETLLEQI
jgi:cytochrome c peroxidase